MCNWGGRVSTAAAILEAEIYLISFWCGKLEMSALALKRIWDLNGVDIVKAA